MPQDLFQFQIMYMQRLQKLQDMLSKQKTEGQVPLHAFQQSMMQVGAKFWANVWQNPNHMMDAQKRYLDMMQQPLQGGNGGYDRYFKSDLWQSAPFFQWIKDIYIKTAQWTIETIEEESLGFNEKEKEKLSFITRQWIEGMNPRNFPMTNPEVWEETIKTNGQNLLDGLDNLIRDIERGCMTMTDENAFEVGKNIATTKGAVIFRNDMMELIQYAPTTDTVAKTPIVIIPPWINKYYILDLNEDKSFIKWMVAQGHTVFCISWKNPDETFRDKGFADYMHEGALKAIEVANEICNTTQVHAMGYCIGGTLLAMTMAWLGGKKKASSIASATFMTTLLDFEHAGDLGVFVDADQIESIHSMLNNKGVMDGKAMATTFAMLRASDLIWSFVINNYFMGKTPEPFDLLYWNSDSTNLPAAMHCDYLQSLYLNNNLTNGRYELDGVTLDITKIQTPAYFISTREDHIAPWQATKAGADIYGGEHEFVLGGSGHIAGIINPPHKNKYGFEAKGKQYEGSWWPHWNKWIKNMKKDETIPARKTLGNKVFKIKDASPGKYVLEKLDR